MRIDGYMNLGDLAEHMGRNASTHEARYMRDNLIALNYWGQDTSDVPEDVWTQCAIDSVRQADHYTGAE